MHNDLTVISYGDCNTWKLVSANDVRYSWEDRLLRQSPRCSNCFNFHSNSPRNAYSSLPKSFATLDQIRFLVEITSLSVYSGYTSIFIKPISTSPHLKYKKWKLYFQQQSEDDGQSDTKQVVRKGIIWHQRDRLFSRWKERFFILTADYFHCFKKDCSKLSEMGEFLFKASISIQNQWSAELSLWSYIFSWSWPTLMESRCWIKEATSPSASTRRRMAGCTWDSRRGSETGSTTFRARSTRVSGGGSSGWKVQH